MKKVTIYIISVIFIFIFGFLAGSFWTNLKLTKLLVSNKENKFSDYDSPDTFSDFVSSPNSFLEFKYFGGDFIHPDKKKTLPEGEGYLVGKFVYEEKPASGISFKLTLNNEYETKPIITNEKGSFTIRLQPGKWFINTIQCNSWDNKPEGNFIMISGDENKINSFVDWYGNFDTGKEVRVTTTEPEKEQIFLTIKKRIEMIWPEAHIQKQEASIVQSRISWRSYPKAKDFVVQLSRVTRESRRSTIYRPISYKKVSGENYLQLSKLLYTHDPTAKEEYSVNIKAYGENGEFLSESEPFMGTFFLSDGNVLVENINDDIDEFGKDHVEDIYRNKKLIKTAETLIKEKMFNETKIILQRINEKDKALLTGYLYAAQSDCPKAIEYFNIAKEKGVDCIPETYKVDCKIDF
jgi:hypothetical protein